VRSTFRTTRAAPSADHLLESSSRLSSTLPTLRLKTHCGHHAKAGCRRSGMPRS
jgi:hypothetical protein